MRILRETFHDVAVIKPMGMATEMRSDPGGASLVSRLSVMYQGRTVKLPHRLDKIVRGIVLAALSDEAARYYNREIQNGLWDKYYLGRVKTPPHQREKSLLGPHKAFLRKKGGRAVVVRSGGDPSLLEILAIRDFHKTDHIVPVQQISMNQEERFGNRESLVSTVFMALLDRRTPDS